MKFTSEISEISVLSNLKHALPVTVIEETDSTNSEARRMLARGAKPPFALLALRQTGGRGRLGRSFFSPDGGIYLSAAFPLADRPFQPLIVTSAAAVAVCRGLETSVGIRPDIKWVNDIWLDEKKLCGILCESTDHLANVIIGIGINYKLDKEAIPEELRGVITSLYGDRDPEASAAEVAAAVIDALADVMNALPSELLSEYRRRSLVPGRKIVFTQNGVSRQGVAEEIDDNAGLIVRTEEGVVCLNTGEISVRPLK